MKNYIFIALFSLFRLFFANFDRLIGTARSNKVAVTLGFHQPEREYLVSEVIFSSNNLVVSFEKCNFAVGNFIEKCSF